MPESVSDSMRHMNIPHSDRVVPFQGRARDTERDALTNRGPRAALDCNRIT